MENKEAPAPKVQITEKYLIEIKEKSYPLLVRKEGKYFVSAVVRNNFKILQSEATIIKTIKNTY